MALQVLWLNPLLVLLAFGLGPLAVVSPISPLVPPHRWISASKQEDTELAILACSIFFYGLVVYSVSYADGQSIWILTWDWFLCFPSVRVEKTYNRS